MVRIAKILKATLVLTFSRHCETARRFVDSSTEYFTFTGEEPERGQGDGQVHGGGGPGRQGGQRSPHHAERGGDLPGEDKVFSFFFE